MTITRLLNTDLREVEEEEEEQVGNRKEIQLACSNKLLGAEIRTSPRSLCPAKRHGARVTGKEMGL